ncbi:MAG: AraC family transcriptional regulator [Eubacteriales bacterium]|jgi:AraC-like DNA-binding protein|nr:AraC family transcriptional regulator [Eubacteriales bacterium]MDD4104662.1 AraC family transcriptional regulator [Eubacteriales bacterium]MDD4710609.1 AraC family transcriptional regulator [Eubacteriales bacterium]NLO14788.1 helix-turn-helix transcriptional regulator [Clostridiales bacterium]
MTQLEAMRNARLFHYACRVPIALYRGSHCFAALPEQRVTASLLLNNGDPILSLDAQKAQLYIPQHLKSAWREYFIFLNAGDDLILLAGPLALHQMDETRLSRMFRVLRPLVHKQGGLKKYLSSLPVVTGDTLFYLAKLLCKLFLPNEENGNAAPPLEEMLPERLPDNLSFAVRGAITYIEHNLMEKLTASTIAEHAGVHRDYLSTLFKKETGIAMMVYIQKRRAEEACHFLRFSSYSITEIAGLCQFSSQSRFTDIFKRHIGMTPAQYREEA